MKALEIPNLLVVKIRTIFLFLVDDVIFSIFTKNPKKKLKLEKRLTIGKKIYEVQFMFRRKIGFLRVSMNEFLARITFSCSFTRTLLIEENEPKTSLSTVGIENEVF